MDGRLLHVKPFTMYLPFDELPSLISNNMKRLSTVDCTLFCILFLYDFVCVQIYYHLQYIEPV